MDLIGLFPFLKRRPDAARSVYFPLVPRAKLLPLPWTDLPDAFLQQILHDAPIPLLSLNSRIKGQPIDKSSFNNIVREMLADRDFVVFQPVLVKKKLPDGSIGEVRFRIEYSFSQKLLKRTDALIESIQPTNITYYDILVDLLMQISQRCTSFDVKRDEVGHYWLRLRDSEPFREGALFSDATIILRCLGPIITVVIGEDDNDIDTWNRYEYMATAARQWLERLD